MAKTYTAAELAAEFDLTQRAVRFYEELGILKPAGKPGQTRAYSSRDRTRLKLILRAKRLGLRLSEAKELIEMFEGPKDTGPQLERYLEVLEKHRSDLEQRLVDLKENLEEVKAQERQARALLAGLRVVK